MRLLRAAGLACRTDEPRLDPRAARVRVSTPQCAVPPRTIAAARAADRRSRLSPPLPLCSLVPCVYHARGIYHTPLPHAQPRTSPSHFFLSACPNSRSELQQACRDDSVTKAPPADAP